MMFRRGARSARRPVPRWVDARARSAAEAGVAGASSHWQRALRTVWRYFGPCESLQPAWSHSLRACGA